MNILVTGGSGNVGTVVSQELLDGGHEVAVFDLKEPRVSGVRFIQGSVTEPAGIAAAAVGIDAIVHLAAIPAFRPEIPPVEFMKVNVTGTFNVLEAAAAQGVRHVIVAGSDSSLGFVFATHPFPPEYFPIDENHPLRPQDPYGLSKLLGEELCKSATRKYKFRTTSLRFCWVWFDDTYAHRDAMCKGDPAGLAKTMWGYVDVHDAAQACLRALALPPVPEFEAFFITAADTFADTPSLELIARFFPESANRFANPSPNASLFDTTKAQEMLGYVPRVSWRNRQ